MKRILPLILFLGTSLSAGAQAYRYINVQVWDTSITNAVPGQRIWIRAYNGTAIVKNLYGYSDSSFFGLYRDSIASSVVFDSIVTYTFDCNGDKVRGSASPILPGGFYLEDTLFQPCPMNYYAGTAGFTYTQSTTQPNTIDFSDNSNASGSINTTKSYFCFFGDNDSALVSPNFSHTYPGPGKYYVQYSFTESDINGSGYYSQDRYNDTIEVKPFVPVGFCQASYWVDTINSGNNVALVYNNSSPSQKDTNYMTSFHWAFGDGDTSNLPFPTHTYTSAGYYQVCLTINAMDSVGANCTSTFCDSLGVDTAGNLIYKNSSFTLQVLDPTIGIDEFELENNLNLFPNPVEGIMTITGFKDQNSPWAYKLVNPRGGLVLEGIHISSEGDLNLDMSNFPQGLYVLQLSSDQNNWLNFRVIKK